MTLGRLPCCAIAASRPTVSELPTTCTRRRATQCRMRRNENNTRRFWCVGCAHRPSSAADTSRPKGVPGRSSPPPPPPCAARKTDQVGIITDAIREHAPGGFGLHHRRHRCEFLQLLSRCILIANNFLNVPSIVTISLIPFHNLIEILEIGSGGKLCI